MALDKAVDSAQLNADLTKVASAIREKGGTSDSLVYPDGFVTAIQAIQTGTELQIIVTVKSGATVTATKGSLSVSHHGQLRGGADVLLRDDHRQRGIRRDRHAEKGRDDYRHKDKQRNGGFHRNGDGYIYRRGHKERADDERFRQCRFFHDLLCTDTLFCFIYTQRQRVERYQVRFR